MKKDLKKDCKIKKWKPRMLFDVYGNWVGMEEITIYTKEEFEKLYKITNAPRKT